MDEYISKQVIIGILDAKADIALGAPKVVFSAAAKMVEKLPAADVVSVVRCRDCIHCEAGGYTDLLYCEYFDWGINADYFCSYGERKDEE